MFKINSVLSYYFQIFFLSPFNTLYLVVLPDQALEIISVSVVNCTPL
jgi:hypothetical protein